MRFLTIATAACVLTAGTAVAREAGATTYMLASLDGGPNLVWEYTNNGVVWNAITGSNTNVTQIAAIGNQLCMVASNDGAPNDVWCYTGNGTQWVSLGINAKMSVEGVAGENSIYALGTFNGEYYVWNTPDVYSDWTQLGSPHTLAQSVIESYTTPYLWATSGSPLPNPGPFEIWQYTWGLDWTQVTGNATNVYQLAGSSGYVYAIANVGSSSDPNTPPPGVWRYDGSGQLWTEITGPSTYIAGLGNSSPPLTSAQGVAYMLASNTSGGPYRVFQYSGSGTNWALITGTNTQTSWLMGTGSHVYQWAHNDGDINRLWQYTGSGTNWASLTGQGTSVVQVAETD